ncbi:MAG: hypothetical protein HPY53_16195 [Brevinematales bacterium]|nr:hypothetical protein [Brevinematales bacterium]
MSFENYSFYNNFLSKSDLKIYDRNALLIYALQLELGSDDIHSIATQSLIDGSDDRQCDLLFLDSENERIILAQAYFSDSYKNEAPATKASLLNSAIAWFFNKEEVDKLPDRLKPIATEVHEAIENELIKNITIWYVHNCKESQNVKNELKKVTNTLNRYLNNNEINSNYLEVGLDTLEEWYHASTTAILIKESFTIPIEGGYTIKDSDNQWEGFSTSIPASWIQKMYKDYKAKLFSANVRDYLGSRKGARNINFGIQKTIKGDPTNLWVYHNGITSLVHSFKENEEKTKITINGFSIVNGAQTCGVIGNLQDEINQSAKLPIRFIISKSNQLIPDIIKYNNSQNKMIPSDYRSNDKIQRKLREEFSNSKYFNYLGGRRGKIEQPDNDKFTIPSDSGAQALISFHGRPSIAYNEKSEIWDKGTYYDSIFNDHISANHIIFVYTLFKRLMDIKLNLINKEKRDAEMVKKDRDILDFLRYRSSIFLFIHAISSSFELITSKTINSYLCLSFSKEGNIDTLCKNWDIILPSCLAARNTLMIAAYNKLKNASEIDKAIKDFQAFIEATITANYNDYKKFSDLISF